MPFFCATNTATYANSCIDALIKTRKLNTYLAVKLSLDTTKYFWRSHVTLFAFLVMPQNSLWSNCYIVLAFKNNLMLFSRIRIANSILNIKITIIVVHKIAKGR